jgi:hypothetical protein
MAFGLQTSNDFKFQMLPFWHSFDQEKHADDNKHPTVKIRPKSQKNSKWLIIYNPET